MDKGEFRRKWIFSEEGKKISLNSQSHGNAQIMNGKQELPLLSALRDKCDRVGHLKKLCGRGILSAGTWKDRICVLYQNQLFLYEKQDSPRDERERSTGLILDLGQLDVVSEAPTRVTRKAANVFLLGTSDRGFFDSTNSRHYFAAKSLGEMRDWVGVLSSCIESEKRRKQCLSQNSLPKEISPERNSNKMTPEELTPKESSTTTLPRSSLLEPLDCGVTKSRVRGPPGRKLPSKKSIDALLLDESISETSFEFRDPKGRATSLSALGSESIDLRPEPRRKKSGSGESQVGSRSSSTIGKAYSTNEGRLKIESHYSSLESDEEENQITNGRKSKNITTEKPIPGPQVTVGTPSSLKLTRRNVKRGDTPIRYSASMTPPPCMLRKIRHDMIQNERSSSHEPDTDSTIQSRTSSRSSLSTLTDDFQHRHHHPPPSEDDRERRMIIRNPGIDTYSSLRKSHKLIRSPQLAKQRNCNGIHSVTSSPITNPRYNSICHHHTLERTIESLRRDAVAAGRSSNTKKKGGEFNKKKSADAEEEVEELRDTVEILKEDITKAKEKVTRLSTPLTNAVRQIASSIKDANELREETLKICESARTAKLTLDKLRDETENLILYLRGTISCQNQSSSCICSPVGFSLSNSGIGMSKGEVERSLECIVESPSCISMVDANTATTKTIKQRIRTESDQTESSELTSSDNETKSIVSKNNYQK